MTANLGFSHVALACSDPLATERFYSAHFGFRRARVIPLGDAQIVFLKASHVYLELFQAREARSVPAPAEDGPWWPGVRHLAFQVDDVDAALAAMGRDAAIALGPMSFDAFIPGWKTVWVKDPDGNIVEISQGFVDQPSPPAPPWTIDAGSSMPRPESRPSPGLSTDHTSTSPDAAGRGSNQ
jgi:glyoxylase I family protein